VRSWLSGRRMATIALAVAAVAAAGLPALTSAASTRLVSVNSDEEQANNHSTEPALSRTGRYVAFWSDASNLGGDDMFNDADVFVRDRKTGITDRVSASIDSNDPSGQSSSPAISANGRFVAFQSSAEDLVGTDSNGSTDIFLTDRDSGVVRLISLTSAEEQTTDGDSAYPSISADARYVAFHSLASDLVPNDGNSTTDVFVRDRQAGTTRRVSLRSNETEGNGGSSYPSISANGRFVAFQSEASNLVPKDKNGVSDIFVRDRQRGTTERVSVNTRGRPGNAGSYEPWMSADGRYVAFYSLATNFARGSVENRYQIFVHDRRTGTTRLVSVSSKGKPANADSLRPQISGDGRMVVFESDATNLTPGGEANTEVYVHDRQLRKTRKLSVGLAGAVANGFSGGAAVSSEGRWAAFHSHADNLTDDADSSDNDVFVRGQLR
jgi:Tol biopolymer transport system component